MPVDTELAKKAYYIRAYTPRLDKFMWRDVNYDISWFTKGILAWYFQKLKHRLNKKKFPKPKEMTVQADICIKNCPENELNRLLSLQGVRIISTLPKYVEGFEKHKEKNMKEKGGKK